MSDQEQQRYTISEVSERTGVSIDKLRRWDTSEGYYKPKRDRMKRRYYTDEDIAVIKYIKGLIEHEGLKPEGVRKRLALEKRGFGKPQTRREAIALLNKIEAEIVSMLELLEKNTSHP